MRAAVSVMCAASASATCKTHGPLLADVHHAARRVPTISARATAAVRCILVSDSAQLLVVPILYFWLVNAVFVWSDFLDVSVLFEMPISGHLS